MVVWMNTNLIKNIKNFFKKKKSYIRFYSVYPGVKDLFPPVKALSIVRSFTKNVPPPGVSPVSKCPGIRKIANTGWIITAPADFIIKTNGDGASFEWAEPMQFGKGLPGTESYVASHDKSQTMPILDDPSDTLHTTIKIETPWRVEASDDMMLLQLPVTYNNESRFTAAHGILDPTQSHVINVQLFWKLLDGETLVRAGTPLAQYIPVKKQDLLYSSYDAIIDEPTETDHKREAAYNYAANCVLLEHDQLGSRLQRSYKILNKYKHKG